MMRKVRNKDTRYFIDIDLKTLKVVSSGYDQKQNLNKGRQTNTNLHRLFLTEGQYNKLVERFATNLSPTDGTL